MRGLRRQWTSSVSEDTKRSMQLETELSQTLAQTQALELSVRGQSIAPLVRELDTIAAASAAAKQQREELTAQAVAVSARLVDAKKRAQQLERDEALVRDKTQGALQYHREKMERKRLLESWAAKQDELAAGWQRYAEQEIVTSTPRDTIQEPVLPAPPKRNRTRPSPSSSSNGRTARTRKRSQLDDKVLKDAFPGFF